jgi:hypothetical protein
VSRLKLKQIEEVPGSNSYRNISWLIIGSAIVTFVYYLPISIPNAMVGEIVEGTNQDGVVYLTTLIESNQPPKRYEISSNTAKLLKSQQLKSENCYIKTVGINGIVPLISDRKIVSFEFNNCR